MINVSKRVKLVTAVSTVVGFGFVTDAAASIYAGARLEIQELNVGVNASNAGTAANGFTFTVNSGANLDASAGNDNDGGEISCVGDSTGSTCNAPPAAVLGGDGSATFHYGDGSRANNDYDFIGTGTNEYSSANSEITTATLIDGTPTSTVSIAESELQPSGTGFETGSASGGVLSETTLMWEFTVPESDPELEYPGTLTLSFEADVDLLADNNAAEPPELISLNSTATVLASIGLTKDGSTDSITWTPNGEQGADDTTPCEITDAGGVGYACSAEADPTSLDTQVSTSTNPDTDSHSWEKTRGDFETFSITITGLTAGTWNLVLDADVNVSTRVNSKAVPEPGVLALFGAGLFGIGLVRRRRRMLSKD